jgi:hypothetical protein
MRLIILHFGIFILLVSCQESKKQKIEIPAKYYNINFEEDKSKLDSIYHVPTHQLGPTTEVPYSHISLYYSYGYPITKLMYSAADTFHYFKNDRIEIEYTIGLFAVGNSKMMVRFISLECLITVKKPYSWPSSDSCFYIIWYRSHFDQFKTSNIDTIYSNLPISIIKNIYPDFNGKLLNGNITKIRLVHKEPINTDKFYNDIELIGFNRFFKNRKDAAKYVKDHNLRKKN